MQGLKRNEVIGKSSVKKYFMEKQQFIEKYQHLFWYFDKSKLSEISNTVLVEFILNYGDMIALKELFDMLGREQVAKEFAMAVKKERDNYFPQVKNFFNLYFTKYVPAYPF